jgi:serine/threonine protein kinase
MGAAQTAVLELQYSFHPSPVCLQVCDFNLSKIAHDCRSGSSTAVCNPRWLAPEVLDGAKATLASDVFSFGVILWETMTWQFP